MVLEQCEHIVTLANKGLLSILLLRARGGLFSRGLEAVDDALVSSDEVPTLNNSEFDVLLGDIAHIFEHDLCGKQVFSYCRRAGEEID